MKIKGLFLSAIMVAGMFSSLNVRAFAGENTECLENDILAAVSFVSVTFAPTGTTLLTSGSIKGCYHRDIALNVKEDAVAYRMTGEVSPLLQRAVEAVKSAKPEMSDDAILVSFINIK